jgi:hypothetical protein
MMRKMRHADEEVRAPKPASTNGSPKTNGGQTSNGGEGAV